MSAVHAPHLTANSSSTIEPTDSDPRGQPTVLSGWGGTTRSRAILHQPTDLGRLCLLLDRPLHSLLARGAGRAYGDAAQNGGGHVVDLRHLQRALRLDTSTGVLTIDSGATIAEALACSLPAGWILPVVPGTKFVTIGGAIAADVHGKNHVAAGSFASCLISFTLHTAGVTRTVDRVSTADLFWATVGGMGLTGIITDATVQLQRSPSTTFLTRNQRTEGLDATMDALITAARTMHTIAWLDPSSPPQTVGRGVVTTSQAVEADNPPTRLSGRLSQAASLCPPQLTAIAVRACSALRWRSTPRTAIEHLDNLGAALFPLDQIPNWNRQFGRSGLLQWQSAIQLGQERALRTILHTVAHQPLRPRLITLKALGPANPGPLSFPLQGWTLAIDWRAAHLQVMTLLDSLDGIVADAGGRIYLAKDARLDPHLVPTLYPAHEAWRAHCDDIDPAGLHTSDLGQRLGLRHPSRRSAR